MFPPAVSRHPPPSALPPYGPWEHRTLPANIETFRLQSPAVRRKHNYLPRPAAHIPPSAQRGWPCTSARPWLTYRVFLLLQIWPWNESGEQKALSHHQGSSDADTYCLAVRTFRQGSRPPGTAPVRLRPAQCGRDALPGFFRTLSPLAPGPWRLVGLVSVPSDLVPTSARACVR